MRPNIARMLAVGLMALLFVLVVSSVDWPEGDMDNTSNEELGVAVFGDSELTGYALIVLLIGLLLLVALLGGVFLAKEEKE